MRENRKKPWEVQECPTEKKGGGEPSSDAIQDTERNNGVPLNLSEDMQPLVTLYPAEKVPFLIIPKLGS